MFSKGQQLFALLFILVFIAILIWSYRKDLPMHKKYYKWAWIITLIAIIIVVAAFTTVTFFLHD